MSVDELTRAPPESVIRLARWLRIHVESYSTHEQLVDCVRWQTKGPGGGR